MSLKGRKIAVTRPIEQAEEAVKLIRSKAGIPYVIPTIEIKDLNDFSDVKVFLNELKNNKVDFVVVMSVNGVRHLTRIAENLSALDILKEGLSKTINIAIGPRTAEELKKYGINVNLVPTKYTSEGIAESMNCFDVTGKSVRIPRTTTANPTLQKILEAKGAKVKDVHVYESFLPNNRRLNQDFIKELKEKRINAIIFGSALCAKNLFKMLENHILMKDLIDLLNKNLSIVAIGPVTADELKRIGVSVQVMPTTHLFEEAINQLINYWQFHS